jgi:hypothetical protein
VWLLGHEGPAHEHIYIHNILSPTAASRKARGIYFTASYVCASKEQSTKFPFLLSNDIDALALVYQTPLRRCSIDNCRDQKDSADSEVPVLHGR